MEKEIHNGTGCEMVIKENGKPSVKPPEIGSMIHVNIGAGSERMIVAYYEGNHIMCDNDGIEACVALTMNGNVLIWKDITEGYDCFFAEK